jgi:hypothetical protein
MKDKNVQKFADIIATVLFLISMLVVIMFGFR